MAGFRFHLDGEPLSAQWRRRFSHELPSAIAVAISRGARDAGADMQRRGREDIARSGNFGTRWTHGFFAHVEPKHGALLNAKINLTHRLWFAFIHEFGGIVRGRPMLWIPLSFAADAKGIYARDYARQYGGLFRVDRKSGGRPLLLSIRDKQPKYFGIEQVFIPKRWNLRGISRDIMSVFGQYYDKHTGHV